MWMKLPFPRRQFRLSARTAFSLMELLAVVTILGVIATIVIPRVLTSATTAKQKVDEENRAIINTTVERYYIEQGSWPADDLSDIGADANYFPDGVPQNPVNSANYTLDNTTHRANAP